jgi:hypothetical protein
LGDASVDVVPSPKLHLKDVALADVFVNCTSSSTTAVNLLTVNPDVGLAGGGSSFLQALEREMPRMKSRK